MKKILSLLLVLFMVISSGCITTFADAEADVDANLIYDLDLSSYISKGTIANTVKGENNNYFNLTTDSGTTEGELFKSENNAIVPYIKMTSSTNKLTYSTTDSNMLGGSYTLEAWIQPERSNASVIGYPFMSINSDSANSLPNDDISTPTQATANVAVGFYGSSNKFNTETGNCEAMLSWHRSGKTWSYASNNMHQNFRKNDWIKVTLVREVVKGETETTIKKRLYINGTNKINGYSNSYWSEFSYTTASFTDELLTFNIGSYQNAYDKFNIADVKLYNDVRTAAEISADYEAEKGNYKVKQIINPNLIYDLDLSSYAAKGSIINGVGENNYFSLTTNGSGKTIAEAFRSETNAIVPYIAMSSTTDKLTYSTKDSDMLGGSYTLEAWIQPERTRVGNIGYPFMSINSDSANSLPENLDTTKQAAANVAVGFYGPSNVFNSETGACEAMLSWKKSEKSWQYASNYMHADYRKDDWIKVTLVREVVKGEEKDTIKKRLYINGTDRINGQPNGSWSEFSYETTNFTDELLSFNIGSYHTAYDKFNIADVKLYNDVRTAAEITADYEAEKAIYKVRELIDANLIYDLDLSSYEKKGTLLSSVGNDNYFSLTTTGVGTTTAKKFGNTQGKMVPYIAMASTTDKLTYSTTDKNMLGGSYTLEAWIQPERLNAAVIGYPFMSINSDSGNSLPDDLDPSKQAAANVAVGFYNTSNKFNAETGNCEATLSWHRPAKNWQYASNYMHADYRRNDWIKVTLVREVVKGEEKDTIKKRLYINGTNKINGQPNGYWSEFSYETTNFTDELLSFNIGSYYRAFEKFNIADVKLYNDARTAAEISADYEAEKGIYTPLDLEEYLYYQTDLESYNPPVGDAGEVHTGYIPNSVAGSEGEPYLRQQGFNGSNKFSKEFIGVDKTLNPIYRAVNSRMHKDKYYLKDATLAGEDILVSAWLEWGKATMEYYNINFFTISGWDSEDNEVNQANLMIGGTKDSATPLWKYGNSAANWDTKDTDNSEKLVHLAIIRDIDYNKVTNFYYRDGVLVATEVVPSLSKEVTAGIEICPGYRYYLNTYDVKVYTGKGFESSDVENIYNAELGSFELPTFTMSDTCTITDKNDEPITDNTQLTDGFKFSAEVEGNGMANAVVALYEDGRLLDMKLVEYNNESTINATFDDFNYNSEFNYSIKLMLLDGLTRVYPMATAVEHNNIFGN